MTQSVLCSLDEKKGALKKALESHTFARSEQLKAFLRFVCEGEMYRPGAALTEYVIGVEVLGRPEGYSPAEDSSVRTRAYELRQKLERLYTRELPDEPVQIVVPKGSYSPQYLQRAKTAIESDPVILVPAADPPRPPVVTEKPVRRSFWFIVAGALTMTMAACFVIWAGFVTWRWSQSAMAKLEPDPILVEAWGPLAEHHATVVLSVATPLALVVGPAGHEVFGSKDYPVPQETYALFQAHRPLPDGEKLGLTFSDNMIAVGTMNAALTAAETLRSFGTAYQLLPERVATASALRGRDAILFGTGIDSDAVSLAMANMPLTIEFEPSIREFVVRDRSTGQYLAPKKNAAGDFTEVFGLLTVSTTKGNDRHRVQSVVLSGITSVGVQGAAEFFSTPAKMSALKALLRKQSQAGFPASYQVVIRCSYTNLLLLSYEYYAHKIVQTSF